MVIYDLECDNGHGFEGWFSGPENYQEQLSGDRIACPVCNSTVITKLPHTCAVHMKKDRAPSPAPRPAAGPAMAAPEQLKEALIRVHHYVRDNFEDVGSHFAQEARRIEAGDADERPIHGTATEQEREALDDEGIPCLMLPKPELDS